ncbi:MAG: 3'-5' exonuclease [Ignavibacteriales bacterium]|nr:3'-5' exonuclease [Ignavibacteriales bacterium]
MNFLAIDFETANYYRDSACAVGLVRVENLQIVERKCLLIKPPSKWFVFSYLHGITWEDVKEQLDFGSLWNEIEPFFAGIDFVVAHNSSFDSSVLRALCNRYNLEMPNINFKCTVNISRKLWGIYPTKLSDVCNKFGIPLQHHEAMSDTLACAEIMIKAIKEGYS